MDAARGTILVTGPTGTVGTHVVAGLQTKQAAVRAGARIHGARAPGMDWVKLDFSRPHTFAPALEGVEQVFLLTPLEERMVDAACALVERAVAEGVRKIVRLSAFSAGLEPDTKLGRVHGEVERFIEASGLQWTFLRPNSFMQNFVNYAGYEIRAHDRFRMPQGAGAVSVIDARDIAAVAVESLIDSSSSNRALELTGAEALSNQRIAETLSVVTGRQIRYVDIPPTEARDTMRGAGMCEWLIEIILELYEYSRSGAAAGVTSAVSDVLGRPPTSFLQFAQDHRDDFRE